MVPLVLGELFFSDFVDLVRSVRRLERGPLHEVHVGALENMDKNLIPLRVDNAYDI